MKHKTLRNLPNNTRFYVLMSSILLSIAVVSWLRLNIPSDQLFLIRTEQVYGLLSLIYLYAAIIISPLGYAIGKQRTVYLEFARRGIGVSAAYFAVLHAAVALWGQLGGFAGIGELPTLFRWSLLGGLIALIVLLLMAATSFDKVVKFMTLRRWKWLHRFVFLGGILILLHIWTIGTHTLYGPVQWTAFIMLVILGALEIHRVATIMARKHESLRDQDNLAAAVLVGVMLWVVLLIVAPKLVPNYHARHHNHSGSSSAHDHTEETQ